MKVGIGNDHAAVELKMQIKEFIESMMGNYDTQWPVWSTLVRWEGVLMLTQMQCRGPSAGGQCQAT